jgi:hypothetical protein
VVGTLIDLIDKAVLPIFEVATAAIAVLWVCLLVLLLFPRLRLRIAHIFVYTSYVTGLYCWFYCVVIVYRTLGLFWLIFGVLMLGVGVFPVAVVGETRHGLWSELPQLFIAIAMVLVPRFGGIWIASRCE